VNEEKKRKRGREENSNFRLQDHQAGKISELRGEGKKSNVIGASLGGLFFSPSSPSWLQLSASNLHQLRQRLLLLMPLPLRSFRKAAHQ
jgi:hypothetical protein